MHDFRDYRVRGSTLLFLTPGQIHSIQPTGGFGGIIISFSQSFFDHKSPPPSELLDLPFFFPVESAPILPIPHGTFFISQAFAEIRREFEMADALAAKSLRAWLKFSLPARCAFIPSSARWSFLSHSELSVSEIGYRLGFHDPSYFGRFFRKGTGSSPCGIS